MIGIIAICRKPDIEKRAICERQTQFVRAGRCSADIGVAGDNVAKLDQGDTDKGLVYAQHGLFFLGHLAQADDVGFFVFPNDIIFPRRMPSHLSILDSLI